MNRREFLNGTAAVAGLGVGVTAFGQAPAQQPAAPAPAQGRGGAGGGRGRGPAANATPAKLARIEIMTLNHNNILKLPWQEATPQRTLSIFDLPQYYVDTYGVRNVQFQSNHVCQDQDNPDMAYIRELRAKLDAAGSKANQINIEIGTMAQMNPQTGKAEALAGDARAAWLARAKKWVDFSPTLGVTALMHNQGALTDDSKAGVTALWKELQDYATPKGVMISGETRGGGPPSANQGRGGPGGQAGQAGAPVTPPPAATPAPAMSEKERIRYVYGILMDCMTASGGYTNLDFGGDTRFKDQQQLHDAIKIMMPRNSGGMHTRVSPTWDLGTAIKYAESIGFKGRYAIEVNDDAAVRIVYNVIVANLA